LFVNVQRCAAVVAIDAEYFRSVHDEEWNEASRSRSNNGTFGPCGEPAAASPLCQPTNFPGHVNPRAALKPVANAVCLSVKCCLATSKTARRKLENTQREDVSQGPSTFSKTFAMRQFSLASNCLSINNLQ
jgi:peroxiredoxin